MGKFTSAIKTILLSVLFLSTTIAFAGAPSWNRVDYTNTTAFLGIVKINDYSTTFPITVEEGDYIGAFVGEECRMIAEVFEYNGDLYVSSVIHGGEDFDSYPYDPSLDATTEEVEWKVWDNSANSEVAEIVLGTLFTKPGNEILSYEIGKSNTNSELESLVITDITIVPDFDPTVLDYTVELPSGSILPVLADYVAEVLDSRATVTVEEAIDFEKNNVTTITVTAEDGTTTEYTITFSEEACAALSPVVTTPVEYCVEAVAEALTATASGTLVWYDDESLTKALDAAPTPETTTAGATIYYVTNDDECESEASKIEVIVYENPTPVIEGTSSFAACVNDDIDLSISGGEFASQTWSGDASTYLSSTTDATTILAATADGTYTLDLEVEDENGCIGAATETITINANPTVTLSTVSDICSDEAAFDIVATPSEDGVGKWSENVTTVDNLTATFDPSINVGDQIITYDFTSANGCALETTATLEFTVTEKTLPESKSPVLVQVDGDAPELTATGDGIIKWYDADKNLLEIADAYQTTIATDVEKSFTFYVTNTNATCESDFVEVIVTITGCLADLPVVTTPVEYCIGETAEALTAIATGTLTWYDDASLTIALAEAPTPETTVDATTTYYVTNTDGGCETTASEIEVVVNELSETPTVANVEICEGETADLTAEGTDLKWYDDAYVLLTEAPIGLTDAATYYVTQNTNGCESDYAQIEVTVNELPVVEISTTTPKVCVGDIVNFTLEPATGGTLSGTGIDSDVFDSELAGAGTHPITYEFVDANGCENSEIVNITVEAFTSPKTQESVTLLVGEDAPTLTATGDGTIKWYDADKNLLETAATYTTTIDTDSEETYTYYVTNTNGTCESDFVEVTVIVSGCTVEAPEVTSTVDYCVGDVATPLLAEGTDLKWYNSATGTGGSATVPTPSTVAAGTTTYYVSQTDVCESPRASITVNVYDKPNQPTVKDITACEGDVIPALSAIGTDISWYDELETLISPIVPEASGVFYATQTINGCESDKATLTVEINSAPSVPIVADASQTLCEGEVATFTAIIDKDATPKWTNEDGTVVSTTFEYTTSTPGTYYVSQSDGTCSSIEKDVVLYIKPIPEAPIVSDVETCFGSSQDITYSGTANWYASQTDVTPLETGLSYTPTVTISGDYIYYVSQIVDGCEGAKSPVTYTINEIPTFTPVNEVVSEGSVIPELTVITDVSNVVNWYGNATDDTPIYTGASFDTEKTDVGIYTYYVDVDVEKGDCKSKKQEITLQITDCEIPSPVVSSSKDEVCEEDVNPTLTATGTNPITWYSDSELTDDVSSSASFEPADVEPGLYTYYAVQTGFCQSASVSVSFTINQLPKTEIVASSSIEKDADRELITVTPDGGDLSGDGIAGNYFDPSLVSIGIHTITYSYTDANGCVGTDSHKITVTAVSLPDRDALGDAIENAKDIYEQYFDDNSYLPSEKEKLKGAITVAEHYYDNYENYTQEQLDEQEEALKQAIKDFEDSQVPAVDVSELEDLIVEAQDLLDDNELNQGTTPGQYPESAFEDLQNAITIAQSYVTNPPKTQIEVTAQENVLKDAIEQFKESLVENPDVTGVSVQNRYVKMIVDETFEPVVTFYPIGATGNLIWESSDSDIVTVNMAGIVTAISRGITQVTGTLIDNNRITVSYSVEVTEVPKLVSTSIAPGLGNAIILEFSEEMASPGPSVYTELFISGTDVPLYTIHAVSVDPTNKKKLIVNLGDYIDDPEDIHITYSGSSIKSVAGAEIGEFHSALGEVSIDDVPMSLFVYPTVCTDKVFVTGAETADVIKVVSTTSAVVATVTDINSNMEIDMTGLPKGVYTIIVVKGKQTAQARVVKQ